MAEELLDDLSCRIIAEEVCSSLCFVMLLMSASLLGIPGDPRIPPVLLVSLCSWGAAL